MISGRTDSHPTGGWTREAEHAMNAIADIAGFAPRACDASYRPDRSAAEGAARAPVPGFRDCACVELCLWTSVRL